MTGRHAEADPLLPDSDLPPGDRFSEALNDYRSMFGAGALPHLFLPAAGMATAARVLRAAVVRGRPVRGWTVARCCGIRQPPDGVLL